MIGVTHWQDVGWLVTYLFLLIWMENCDHLLEIFCQEAGWWRVMKSFQLGAHTGALSLIYIAFPFNSNLNSSLTLLLNFETQEFKFDMEGMTQHQ